MILLMFLAIVAGLVLLGAAAALYGADSRDDLLDQRGPRENLSLL